MVPVPPMSVGLHAPLLAPHSDSITNNPLQPRPGKYVGKHIFPSFSSFQFRFMLLPQSNPKLVLQLWTQSDSIMVLEYLSRATTVRGHNSRIAFLAIKLPDKRYIKIDT